MEACAYRREPGFCPEVALAAEWKGLRDLNLHALQVEAFTRAAEPFRAAFALLRQVEADPAQAGFLRFTLESLLRTAETEIPPRRFLDSLLRVFPAAAAAPLKLVEAAAWDRNLPETAFAAFRRAARLAPPSSAEALRIAQAFYARGFFDYAAQSLETAPWRRLEGAEKDLAEEFFYRIRFRLRDWKAIEAEAPAEAAGRWRTPEKAEALLALTAARLALGKHAEALDLARALGSVSPSHRHRARLLEARALLALRRFAEAEALLDREKKEAGRRESSGPLLFWQGFLALSRDRFGEADSLFVLSSAYAEAAGEESSLALHYRRYLLLDTSEAARPFYRGLPEAPFPDSLKLLNLQRLPESSPLFPFARLEKALLLLKMGRREAALPLLDSLAASSSPLAPKAAARAAYLRERARRARAEALADYESLLLKYPRGVHPEFSRERIRALR